MLSPGILILSSPSGGGKTSLAKALLERCDETGLTVSHTTRPQRQGETHGIDYIFTPEVEFKQMINNNAFVEHANVFGHLYGTSIKSIDELLSAGKHAILDIDWQGARIVKQKYPLATSVFVMPPTIDELETRLRKRNQDSDETIKLRMQEALAQISHKEEFDLIVINENFQHAVDELQNIVNNLTPINKSNSVTK